MLNCCPDNSYFEFTLLEHSDNFGWAKQIVASVLIENSSVDLPTWAHPGGGHSSPWWAQVKMFFSLKTTWTDLQVSFPKTSCQGKASLVFVKMPSLQASICFSSLHRFLCSILLFQSSVISAAPVPLHTVCRHLISIFCI